MRTAWRLSTLAPVHSDRSCIVKSRNSLIGLGLLVVSAGSAHAQGLTLPWDEITPLTAEDRGMIGAAVQQHIHGQRPDTVARWSNPASGHSGTVTLLAKSTRQGMP